MAQKKQPAKAVKAPVAKVATRAALVPAKPVEAAQQEQAAEFNAYVQETTKIVDEGTETMVKEATQATQEVTARAQAMFGDVNERAKSALEKNVKLVEEVTELTKGNVEAIVASSKIAARGVETLSQEVAEYSRKSFEEASAALKSFAEVKSPTDFFKLQSDYARTAFDSLVAESSKVSEAVIKLAGEVAEPITNRYSVAAERVKNAVAA